jgi:hypothetical protein
VTTKAAFCKRNGALHPMDDDGTEMLRAMKEGRQVIRATTASFFYS